MPFAYLLFLAIYLLAEAIMPTWVGDISDRLLELPIYGIIGLLVLGHLLKLCAWFRAACLLPLATKVESYVDSFVVTFTQGEVILINTLLGITFIVFLAMAYRHFFGWTR